MFRKALISSVCFLAPLLAAHPSIEMLYEHHLDTSEGRTCFLTEQLTPYMMRAGALNQEILELSYKIEVLSPEQDQAQILALAEKLTSKMGLLNAMLSTLELMTTLEEDLDQIESMLHQSRELSPEQIDIADRVASICHAVYYK